VACRRFIVVSLVLPAALIAGGLEAQGVTTASIEGDVTLSDALDPDGARVRVTNQSGGYAVETVVRYGRFSLLGLEVGGPYSVIVQKIGYRAEGRDRIYLSLGQRLDLRITIERVATSLETVRVSALGNAASQVRTGVGRLISDSALRRLPTIDRDVYDFVRLSPQIVSGGGRAGLSGGGVSTRYNSFLLDGVSERGLLGNLAAGTGQGGKSISIEAVKEYQVLLSPFNVRYGDFSGALVNAVAKSGSAELSGSAFAYARSDELARETAYLRGAPYARAQFGFTLGGPIVRSRARFFIASEFQRLTSPAAGPYVGQPTSSDAVVPAATAAIDSFSRHLVARGIEPGSAGHMEVGNPLRNFFVRADINVPEARSRVVLWNNYSFAENTIFTRLSSMSFYTRGSATFPLSSYRYASGVTKEVAAAQLFTTLRRGGINELLVAVKLQPSSATPDVRAPLVSVTVPRTDAIGSVNLEAGSNEAAHGIKVRQVSFEIADDVALVVGASHRVGIGLRAERFGIQSRGLPGIYGSWVFSSLDSLRDGKAERFRLVTEAERGGAAKPGTQIGAYTGDEWQIHDRLSVVAGLRADAITSLEPAAYNPVVDSIFGRRTSDRRRMRIAWSPRVGFNWTASSNALSHVRGGIGLFVSRPPVGWLGQSLRNNGATVGVLMCGVGGSGPAPAFSSDYRNQPHACADGSGAAGGPLDLADNNLRLGETLRASLSYDRMLSRSLLWKIDGLLTRNRADFLFVNMNLAGPVAMDRHGRAIYGVFDPSGRATPRSVAPFGKFSEVIDLRNQSHNRSLQISTELEQHFSDAMDVTAFYAWSRVRDVQTPSGNFGALENWASGRVVSGLHSDLGVSISGLDVPHRVGLTGTYSFGSRKWTTDLSLYYIGESGAPFTYIAAAGRGRGDLNADGTNLNDPIYIPLNAADASEILFTGTTMADIEGQQVAFEELITSTPCLRRQRGQIMKRNTCRAPWVNLSNMSIRQRLPQFGGHSVTLQLDVFNLLNLLNAKWGEFRVVTPGPNASLLEQVRQTSGTPPQSQPVFRFNALGARFDSQTVQSGYQLQLGARYTF
jgi:hypothetical protein